MRLGKISDWTKPGEEVFFKTIRLKPMQVAILNCNKDNNVLVNLPTGFGKSLLFQYPASQLKNKCIVVFVPLKALLWDCLKQAELFKITAEELTARFIQNYFDDKKLPQLLFLTPERLFSTGNGVLSFVDMLYDSKMIELMVIDEAHCISEWGSDFRPDYARLCELRSMFPGVKLLGMSATIPPEAREDLVKNLKIPGSYYFQSSSNRSNLIYEVKNIQKFNLAQQIVTYLHLKRLSGQPGIIYCQTIKSAEKVFAQLQKLKLECCLFHSKLPEKKRSQNFNKFMKQQIKVVVATICFGMGVNKKNIRYVINAGVSLSAENYYQQSGRAGRDGQIAYCPLFSFKGDTKSLQWLISKSTTKPTLEKRRLYKLYQIKKYTQSNECRKKHLFALLGQEFSPEQCRQTCDFCKGGFTTEYIELDYTEIAMKLMNEYCLSKIQITRRQLIPILKGKQKKLKDKVMQEKIKPLIGLLKDQSEERIELLLDTLIQQKLLIKINKTIMRKFKVQYLSACKMSELRRKDKIKLKITKRTQPQLTYNNKNKEKSEFADKFQNYVGHKKTKSEELPGFSYFKIAKKDKTPATSNAFEDDTEEKAAKKQQYNYNDEELQEIKMTSMGVDYLQFFEDIFGEQLKQQPSQKKQNQISYQLEDCIELIEEKTKNQKAISLDQLQGDQLQNPMLQPPQQAIEQKKQAKNIEEDSLDDEFIGRIRKQKEDLLSRIAVLRAKYSINVDQK